MKKLIFILALCLSMTSFEVEAKVNLKKITEKADKVVKKAEKGINQLNTGNTGVNKTSPSVNKSNSNNTSQAIDYNDDGFKPLVEGLHEGTISEYDPNLEPKITASTVKVMVPEVTRIISYFFDGVAYVYTAKGGFYIDKKGNRLFDTDVCESDASKMPRFNNGVVMEFKDKTARIRDRHGNIIKEFPKVESASHFEDGVAILIERDKSGAISSKYNLNYVDTKGNYVFPQISLSGIPVSIYSPEKLLRGQSEGLTAFPGISDDGYDLLWGFHDASGNIVVEPRYVAVGNFSDGLAAVATKVNDEIRWGFIDKSGGMVIEPKFPEMPSDFDSGYSVVVDRMGAGYYMNKKGDFVLGPIEKRSYEEEDKEGDYFYIGPFINGYAVVGVKVKDPEMESILVNVFFSIDSNFNKLAWAKSLIRYPSMGDVAFIYHDGNFYNTNGIDDFLRFNPRTMDRLSNESRYIYNDGLMPVTSISGKNTGYVDENGNYVIIFEKSRF